MVGAAVLFPSVDERDRGSGVIGTANSTIAPHSRGQLWTHTVFQLLSGHESRTPEQTVIIHPGERRVWPEKEDSREENMFCLEHAEVKKTCFIQHNTFHRYFSLSFFPPTQKARSITESWNTEA